VCVCVCVCVCVWRKALYTHFRTTVPIIFRFDLFWLVGIESSESFGAFRVYFPLFLSQCVMYKITGKYGRCVVVKHNCIK